MGIARHSVPCPKLRRRKALAQNAKPNQSFRKLNASRKFRFPLRSPPGKNAPSQIHALSTSHVFIHPPQGTGHEARTRSVAPGFWALGQLNSSLSVRAWYLEGLQEDPRFFVSVFQSEPPQAGVANVRLTKLWSRSPLHSTQLHSASLTTPLQCIHDFFFFFGTVLFWRGHACSYGGCLTAFT